MAFIVSIEVIPLLCVLLVMYLDGISIKPCIQVRHVRYGNQWSGNVLRWDFEQTVYPSTARALWQSMSACRWPTMFTVFSV